VVLTLKIKPYNLNHDTHTTNLKAFGLSYVLIRCELYFDITNIRDMRICNTRS